MGTTASQNTCGASSTRSVDGARVRRVRGANGMAFVALDEDGDRRFVASNRGESRPS